MFIKLFKLNKKWNAGEHDYYLSEITINSSKIVYMAEDVESISLLREGKINLSLHEAASFTKIKLSSAHGSPEQIVVVGNPNLIEQKILRSSSRQLLRD